jgi:methionine-rich copper-binding protein CopC
MGCQVIRYPIENSSNSISTKIVGIEKIYISKKITKNSFIYHCTHKSSYKFPIICCFLSYIVVVIPMKVVMNKKNFFYIVAFLLIAVQQSFCTIDQISLSLIPTDLIITGAYTDVSYTVSQSNTPQQFELTFVREGPDGCGTLQNLLTGLPGQDSTTGHYTISLCDGDRVENRIFVIGRETSQPALTFGAPTLVILSDTVPPDPPNIDEASQILPATIYTRTFTLNGNVNNQVTMGNATDKPETAGSVTVYYLGAADPITGVQEQVIIGGGLIQPDSSFVSIIDLTSFATNQEADLFMYATDPLGHRSADVGIGKVTKGVGGNAQVLNTQLIPAADSITNHSGVMIKGDITGTVGPFTVNFYMDGFLNSQISGLQSGDNFSHTLNMNIEGQHCFAVEIQNSNTPIYTSPRTDLGCITLDLTPPPAPQILQPDPATTPVLAGPTFEIRGLSEGDVNHSNTLYPHIHLFGPAGVDFSPVSPVQITTGNGEFRVTVDIQNLPDGQHIIEVKAEDEVGNTGPGSVSRVTFVKDSLAPVVEEIRVNNIVAPQVNPPIFLPSSSVKVSIRLNEASVTAPNLAVNLTNGSQFNAGLFSGGGTSWTYSFGISHGKDGPASVVVSGGRDQAGNELNYKMDDLFYVDTAPPVIKNMVPKERSILSKTPEKIRLIFEDPVQSGNYPVSGVDTNSAHVALKNPDGSDIQFQLVQFDPITVDVVPEVTFEQEGDYRIEVQVSDKAGNQSLKDTRLFSMDFTAITTDRITCTPNHDSYVRHGVTPFNQENHHVEITVDHPEFDPHPSTIILKNYKEIPQTLPGVQSTPNASTLRYTLNSSLPSDSSKDGKYVIESTVYDQPGNKINKLCVFTYDNCKPTVKSIFPAHNSVVSKNTRISSALLEDCVPRFDVEISDIDTSNSTIKLFKLTNEGAIDKEIETKLRFETVPGQRAYKVLLEVVDSTGMATSLPNDGTGDGSYQVQVQAYDRSGNASAITSSIFYLDTQEPVLLADKLVDGLVLSGGEYHFSGKVRDNVGGKGMDRVEIKVEQLVNDIPNMTLLNWAPVTMAGKPLPPYDPDPPFRDWTYTLQINVANTTDGLVTLRAYDLAGNYRDFSYRVKFLANSMMAPMKSSPTNNWTTSNYFVDFVWEKVENAQSYEMEIITPAQNYRTYQSNGTSFRLNISNLAEGEGIYQWNIRAVDSLGNKGTKSLNTNFKIDQTRPSVSSIQIIDPSPESQGRITAGETRFLINFSEPMDITKVPVLYLNKVDSSISDQCTPGPSGHCYELQVLSFQQQSITARITLDTPTDTHTPLSGLVRVMVEGGYDPAQNPLQPVDTGINLFEVNAGPYFDIKFFSNPIDPNNLTIIVKGFAAKNGAGIDIPEIPSLIAITDSSKNEHPIHPFRLTASAFSGTLDLKLVGNHNFQLKVTGRDKYGNTNQRIIFITMSQIFASKTTVLSHNKIDIVIPQNSVKTSKTMVLVPPDTVNITNEQNELGFVEVLPSPIAPIALKAESLISGSRLPLRKTTENIGLYYYDSGRWNWLPYSTNDKDNWQATSSKLGPLAFLTDTKAPEFLDSDSSVPGELKVSLQENGSGLNLKNSYLKLEDSKLKGEWNEEDETIDFKIPDHIRMSKAVLEVEDNAGNKTIQANIAVAGGQAMTFRPFAYPNPAKETLYFKINTNFIPDSTEMYIYDVSGRSVYKESFQLNSGTEALSWPLINNDGGDVANGVYIMKIKVKKGERIFKDNLKFAVIR